MSPAADLLAERNAARGAAQDDVMTPEQEQAETELRAEDRMAGIAEYTPQGRLTRASPAFLAMLDYRSDEVCDIDHREFCPAETVESDSYTNLWIQLRAGETRRQKERRMARGRRDVWVDTTYVPIRDDRGTVCSVIEFARDITDDADQPQSRKRGLGAGNTVFGMVQFDTSGTIRDFNDGFPRMIGYSARSLKDQHHSILCPADESVSQEYRDFWQALSKGEARTGYFNLLGHLGRAIVVIGSYLPIRNMAGGIDCIVLFAIEVTRVTRFPKTSLASTMTALAKIDGLATGQAEDQTDHDALERAIAATRDGVADGKTSVAGRFAAVQKVETAIRSIRHVVDTVSEIAPQTNLVAFDAAVEMARGGQSGKGPPAVADEVRRLVERDAGVARDILAQLRSIADRITAGTGGSQVAVASLDVSSRQLTEAVSRVQTLVAASVAQAQKVNQTAEVLRDLREGTKA